MSGLTQNVTLFLLIIILTQLSSGASERQQKNSGFFVLTVQTSCERRSKRSLL